MSMGQSNILSQMETSRGTLLKELQIIWDEVGKSDSERVIMLLQLEQECLEVYRRKVDLANKDRSQLRQVIADAEAELAAICSAMGERPVHTRQADQNPRSLKAELEAILPQIEELQKKKCERKNQFIAALEELYMIKNDICGSEQYTLCNTDVDETDLCSRKLEELHRELKALQEEKSARLNQISDHLNLLYSLCSVLGLDFKQTVNEIHPSLRVSESAKSISNHTLQQLETATQRLQELKTQRLQQLKDLATSLLELWNLMDTPIEEQQIFQNVTRNIVAAEEEITEPEILSVDFINHVKAEVSRLEELKARILTNLILKKKAELEDIHRKAHLIQETDEAMDTVIESEGAVDAACVLEKIELQISRAKEEALSRKEILEKVEKWIAACEEESWLEEYNRDDNRYNAGRGAHLTLRRAEKARVLINKLPGMVDTLASKTLEWENEKGLDLIYDGVRLLSMLEGYMVLRQEKELEQKRLRDQRKLQGQLLTEQEALYGSKPSPVKNQTAKKGSRLSYGGPSNRRLSLGGPMPQTHKPDLPPAKATPIAARTSKKNEPINLDRFRENGFAALSSGSRGLDIAGLPLKLHPFEVLNACELESPIKRKPFSPISSTDSSNSNATNLLEDLHKKHSEMLQKTLLTSNNTHFSTPPKILATTQEDNRTPQTMPIPVPFTPSTVSIPMQTGLTPALKNKYIGEEIEYSFEERRAGFVLPRPLQPMPVTQV